MRQALVLSGLILLFLISSFSVVVRGEFNERSGTVSWIVDGDTFDINYVRYRMADIDAPKSDENYEAYQASKYYLLDLIHGKIVYLDIDNKYTYDNYGNGERFVCITYLDYNSTHYLNVNKAMTIANYAITKNYDNEFNPNSWTLFVLKPSTTTPVPSPTPSPVSTQDPTPTFSPSPGPIPNPMITPTPSVEPTPTGPSIRFYNPYLIIFGSALLLVGVGILVYFKKYRK